MVGIINQKSPLGSTYRRVVMVGDEGVVFYAVEKKKVIRVLSLPWAMATFETQMVNALKGDFKGPVVVIIDWVEVHYRKDKLPKVGALDKAKVLKRKLKLAFPNFNVAAALELKDKQSKGLNFTLTKADSSPPEYLLAALPVSENLDRVIKILYEAGVSIKGLGLLPVESVGLVDSLTERSVIKANGVRSKWSVYVSHHETGGLRQIVTKDGQLALTRLTPISEGALQAGLSSEIIKEFQATLSYIARYGYTQADGIDLVIVADKDSHNAIKVANLPVQNVFCVDLLQATVLLGGQYVGQAASTYGDALHALWIAKKSKLDMPMQIQSLDRISRPRSIIKAVTALGILGILGLIGFLAYNYIDYSEVKNEIAAKTTQKNVLSRDYAEESKAFDVLPVKPAIVNDSLDIKKTLEDNSIDIPPLLARLDSVLGTGYTIKSLEVSHMASEKSILAKLETKKATGVRRIGQAIAKAVNQNKDNVHGEITVSMSVGLTENLSLEQRVVMGEALLGGLKTNFPKHEVELIRQFSDISRTGSFTGSATNDAAAQAQGSDDDTAQFEIVGPPL